MGSHHISHLPWKFSGSAPEDYGIHYLPHLLISTVISSISSFQSKYGHMFITHTEANYHDWICSHVPGSTTCHGQKAKVSDESLIFLAIIIIMRSPIIRCYRKFYKQYIARHSSHTGSEAATYKLSDEKINVGKSIFRCDIAYYYY